jgi:uncharacterized protein YjeT (DUF2065 family)
MAISVFLAKLLGLYLLILALLCIFRKHQIMLTSKELISSKGILALSGEFSLVFGLVVVIDHSIWELSWRGVITVIGYLLILKGIIRFAFPGPVQMLAKKILDKGYWFVCTLLFILGAYLTYCGFCLFQMNRHLA